MGEGHPRHLDRVTRSEAHSLEVVGGGEEAVIEPGADDLGEVGGQLLGGHDVGVDALEQASVAGGVGAAVVQVRGQDPKHRAAMVCDYWTMSFSGRLLIATPLIRDPNFIHTVVYIYAHEPEEGAAGVILNRPTDEPTVAHLPEWRSVLAAPPTVFWGGPVAQDSGVVLIDAGGRVEVATDMTPPDGPVRARLFVGQSGARPSGEDAKGRKVIDAPAEDPGAVSDWRKLLRREGDSGDRPHPIALAQLTLPPPWRGSLPWRVTVPAAPGDPSRHRAWRTSALGPGRRGWDRRCCGAW